MKVTKKQLKKLISEHIKLLKEERYDCIKDYMAMGYSRSEAQKECPPDEDDDDYGASYGGRSRSSYSRGGRFPKKTSYVGVEANAEKISALEASLEKKSDKFLNSVLSQLKGGRGLSAKQKAIVKKILIKTSPESVALFESSTRNYKMKITKRQLRRIIKEEKHKLLREQGGWEQQTGSMLLDFAQAWASLGGAVQEQVVAVTAAWERGAHEPDWSESVYEQNPNAIDMAVQRLGPFLRDLGEEGEFLWDALEEAQKIYREGDEEVEADARAAGDR